MQRSQIIQEALTLVARRLDDTFQVADPSSDPWVVLSNLVDHGGTPYPNTLNKVVLFLANIQQDTTMASWPAPLPSGPDRAVKGYPPVYINLSLLFFANFSGGQYPLGLGMASQTIQFFQENPYFDRHNCPDLPMPIDKLAFELTNLNPVDLNYLMGLAGVKYLPCVHYKVRMIPVQSGAIRGLTPVAKGVSGPIGPEQVPPDAPSPAAPTQDRRRTR